MGASFTFLRDRTLTITARRHSALRSTALRNGGLVEFACMRPVTTLRERVVLIEQSGHRLPLHHRGRRTWPALSDKLMRGIGRQPLRHFIRARTRPFVRTTLAVRAEIGRVPRSHGSDCGALFHLDVCRMSLSSFPGLSIAFGFGLGVSTVLLFATALLTSIVAGSCSTVLEPAVRSGGDPAASVDGGACKRGACTHCR
jgi:hypothetical protein